MMMSRTIFTFVCLFFLTTLAFSDVKSTPDANATDLQSIGLQEAAINVKLQLQQEIKTLKESLRNIEKDNDSNNVWVKSYTSYLTSLDIKNSLEKIKNRIDYLSKYAKTSSDKDELSALISKENILSMQVQKLKGESDAPFSKLITPPVIDENINISNPFDIFTGFSLIKTLNENFSEYEKKKESLSRLIMTLRKEGQIYSELELLETNSSIASKAKEKKNAVRAF